MHINLQLRAEDMKQVKEQKSEPNSCLGASKSRWYILRKVRQAKAKLEMKVRRHELSDETRARENTRNLQIYRRRLRLDRTELIMGDLFKCSDPKKYNYHPMKALVLQ